jgi:hypothetical protein
MRSFPPAMNGRKQAGIEHPGECPADVVDLHAVPM